MLQYRLDDQGGPQPPVPPSGWKPGDPNPNPNPNPIKPNPSKTGDEGVTHESPVPNPPKP